MRVTDSEGSLRALVRGFRDVEGLLGGGRAGVGGSITEVGIFFPSFSLDEFGR